MSSNAGISSLRLATTKITKLTKNELDDQGQRPKSWPGTIRGMAQEMVKRRRDCEERLGRKMQVFHGQA